MAQRIFRKVSLERLSSPEQLDLLMRITTPKGWVALIAMGCLLLLGVAWGIWGRIPTKVKSQGILLKSGGIYEIVASGTGRVKGIYCNVDEQILKGQTIARIAQPDLIHQINAKRERLQALEIKQEQLTEYFGENTRLEKMARAKERDNLEKSANIFKERVKWLKEKIKKQEKLHQKGLITKEQWVNTKKDFNTTKQEIEIIRNHVQQLDIKDLELENRRKQEMRDIENQINEAKMDLKAHQHQADTAGVVKSDYSGRVIEIDVEPGAIVNRGTPLVRIEPVGKHLREFEAVLFFPPADGEKIRLGMVAHVSPSTVKREKFGYMVGIVTEVSRFPTSSEAMMRILHNQNLVQALTSQGPPVEVRADLIPDPETPTGIKWTSSTGPSLHINSGTLCAGEVTILKQPPISLVIPLFKKYVLGIGEDRG